MPTRKLYIDANCVEVRIALVEDDKLAEVQIERKNQTSVIGNIYKGVVTRVIPGMQAAFVNIGLEKSAFLFGGDIVAGTTAKPLATGAEKIEQLISVGDELIVQIIKDKLSSKGPRVTTSISLANNFLVLTPFVDQIAISRRIVDEGARESLRELLVSLKPEGMGLIGRTSSGMASIKDLQTDLQVLLDILADFRERSKLARAPSLIYQDNNLALKTIQDHYASGLDAIVVNDFELFKTLESSLVAADDGPKKSHLQYYDKKPLLFDFYNLEHDIEKCLSKKAWLSSGGYIVIDQTEALTSFDVNTGRFHGKKSLEENIYQVNFEACEEIAKQLRRRNIGGIIVIDFIDMDCLTEREKLTNHFASCLTKDKARTKILAMNEFGLLQMTRKRTSESLPQLLTAPCQVCLGTGRTKSLATIGIEMYRDILRLPINPVNQKLILTLSRDLYDHVIAHETELMKELGHKFILDLKVRAKGELDLGAKYAIHVQ